jgi:hypothetical protein
MLNNKRLLSSSFALLFLSIIIILFILFSEIIETNHNVPYQITKYDINELNDNEMPYAGYRTSLDVNYPTDAQGIIIFIHQGKEHYHPVQIAQKILSLLGSYNQTNNSEYLNRAKLFAQKLIEISFESKDAIYFPYNFDFPLHGIEEEKMIAPWYSGMAQGQALSAFVRLYKITGENKYLAISDKIFRSFTHFKGENEPWIVYVDKAGYLWIEEYPMEVPAHALNGFIFGIYGLYDYYLLKRDIPSKQLLQASITTIRQYISEFRNEGDISFYDLKYKTKSVTYHRIHIHQLAMLYKITGDDYFRTMSDNFYQVNDWQALLTYTDGVTSSVLSDADHYVGHLIDLPPWTQGYDHYYLKIKLDGAWIEPPQKKCGVRVFANGEMIKEYPISNEVIHGWERIPIEKRFIEGQKKLYVSLQAFGAPDVFENYLAVFILKGLHYGLSVFNGSTRYLSIDRDEEQNGTFLIGLEMRGKGPYRDVDLWLGSHLSQADKLSLLGDESEVWYNLGQNIRLIGHKVNSTVEAGETLRPRLYWQAQAPMDQDYIVFVHLLDEGGNLRAQQDCQPQRGDYPTSLWRLGEVIWDGHEIPLPADLPAGTYRLVAGMYLLESMERLPVLDETGRRLPDDVIPLGEIQVVGSQQSRRRKLYSVTQHGTLFSSPNRP